MHFMVSAIFIENFIFSAIANEKPEFWFSRSCFRLHKVFCCNVIFLLISELEGNLEISTGNPRWYNSYAPAHVPVTPHQHNVFGSPVTLPKRKSISHRNSSTSTWVKDYCAEDSMGMFVREAARKGRSIKMWDQKIEEEGKERRERRKALIPQLCHLTCSVTTLVTLDLFCQQKDGLR